MRFSAARLGNLVAWGGIFLLIGLAVAVVLRLGPFGLLVLGLLTCLICVRAELDNDTPTWGAEVFRARLQGNGSADRRAAADAERGGFVATLRYYKYCGGVLVLAGLTGLGWQYFRG